MYEYDPADPTLGQSIANILRGLKSPEQWQEVGQGIVNTGKVIPSVAESLARGGVAQAVGTMGDLRDLRNTVQSYLPKSLQNFSNAAEFLSNPYAKALIQTAPTTEQTLEDVPRVTAPYEGYKQHETLGEFIAPSLGYFGGKVLKAGKGLPVGLSIEDVTPPVEPAKVAEALRQPEKNELGFYSPLEEAVIGLKNEKGTGQQYLAQLLKTGGVKPEEVSTRGLDTFLESNPKVSKQQIVDYLRDNPVELKETVIGADSTRNLDSTPYSEYSLGEGRVLDDPDYIDSRASDLFDEIKQYEPDLVENYRTQAFEDLEIDPFTNDPSELSQVDDLVDDYIRDGARIRAEEEYYDSPYYEFEDDLGYKVTGSDDVGYIIKDPNGREVPVSNRGVYDIGQVEDYIREDALDRGFLHYDDDAYGTKYHDYTLPNGENYKEVLIQYEPKRSPPNYEIKDLPSTFYDQGKKFGVYDGDKLINTWTNKANAEDWLKGAKDNYKEYGNFESSHFDEPNILAHFRTTDRTIDGKKTLFVEEIQSDWHQAGRKKGYATPLSEQRKMDIRLELDKLNDMKSYARTQRDAAKAEGLDTTNEDMRLANIERQQVELRSELSPKGVPDAPFKKNWQELAMKRAMQMAAEGGYDRVAFTTGKQQAERYNLAKYVETVIYDPELKKLIAWDKNSQRVIDKEVPMDQLEDYIGKEAARKIEEAKPNQRGEKVLNNADLAIGGEGMKGFYDKILPDFINKYGKKHGLKTGKTSIDPDALRHDLTDEQLAAGLEKIGMTSRKYYELPISERSPIYQRISREFYPSDKNDVHYFDLTPEAKESFLKKGQPMFAVAPLALPATRKDLLEQLFEEKQEKK